MIEKYLTISPVIAKYFISIAMIVFGIQHIVYGDFVTRVFPNRTLWGTGRIFWAYLLGGILIAAGCAIINTKTARSASLLLGFLILGSFLLLYAPFLVIAPSNGGLWTRAGKSLALSGACFIIAGSLKSKSDSITRRLEILIPLGRFFLAAFLVLCGIQHFIYIEFVAALVPSWIPWHTFWAYFTGIALIAGGIGMCVRNTSKLAALMTGAMIFSWIILLHVPRALADMQHPNETTAVFEALALSGAAFLVAKKT